MPLSNDLISRFVKITNDGKKTKNETVVYGTISTDKSDVYVTIDGADYSNIGGATGSHNPKVLVTNKSVTEVKNGDRVTVLIKNHTAIITGNIDDPSTNKGYTDTSVGAVDERLTDLEKDAVRTSELDAKVAYIEKAIIDKVDAKYIDTDELSANNATFKEALVEELDAKYINADELNVDELNASVGKVSELESDNVKINEQLTAHAGVIDNLDSKYATIERMDVAEADINELEAKTAKIDVLESDVADINTLIFNNASGGTMHANFANAVIALLGSAWIKSAMIESVAADKIAGDIVVTEDLEIVSADGHIKIQNGVIQVLDDDKNVRVQLGKDASNNYSITIWDADGNKMFDAGGITADAIKSDIIVNNMVSATADIDASKLNIDSLFNVINNDGTNTIKATRVQLDEKGQTLEVAFNTLNDEVDAQGTEINVLKDEITSKVWQQDIDDATDTMSTQYSELQQEVDGISATVASHTTRIGEKADNSTVITINNKITSMESDLSGFKTTVSDTYATKTDVNNLTDRISTAETSMSQNAEAIMLRATKTEMTEAIDSIEIGGRNLIAVEDLTEETYGINFSGTSTKEFTASSWAGTAMNNAKIKARLKSGETYTISCELEIIDLPENNEYGIYDANIAFYFYSVSTNYDQMLNATLIDGTHGHLGAKYVMNKTFIMPEIQDDTRLVMYTSLYKWSNGGPGDPATVKVTNLKLEKGNKPTDWTPAPEDMATEESLDTAYKLAEAANTGVIETQSLVQQLSNSISMLVTDGNGTSLMTQTEDGWTFSTANIQNSVNSISEDLNSLTNDIGDIDNTVSILQQAIDELGVTAEYVRIVTYEDEPCIELGESDSDFKLRITNTRMMFTEGSTVLAYFNNQSMHIQKVVIEEELQQGQFAWTVRSNGNLGLVWKGGNG